MALIGSRVNSNTVRARVDHSDRELAGVRMFGIPGVSDQRNLIQINAQFRHGDSRLTERMTTGFTGTS